MKLRRPSAHLATVALMLCSVGCAPVDFMAGLRFAADQHGVRDASMLGVAGRGHLRFDVRLRSDLDDAVRMESMDEMKLRGSQVLRDARGLAVAAVANEVDRMPRDGVDFIVRRYGVRSGAGDLAAKREAIRRRFEQESEAALQRDLARLKEATTAGATAGLLRDVLLWIEAPVGDRGKAVRLLVAGPAFVPVAIGAEIAAAEAEQRTDATFEKVIRYRPAHVEARPTREQLEQADPAVLAGLYAPIFVQEYDPSANYDPVDDQIGQVWLSGTPPKIDVHVKVEEPVVYWTVQQAKIGDQRYDQLVYVVWYPSRPTLTPDDNQAGHIDGVVVRMTLDSHKRPAVYEFVRSCGCYHTLWVAEFVEAAAREAFGSPRDARSFAVRKAEGLAGRALFLPALIDDDGSSPHRPWVYVSAGHHLLLAIRLEEQQASPAPQVLSERTYRLEPYDTLTRLPLNDGVASMFGGDGLVHHAGRKEGWLLAPTGMLSAGQPRQLGTMKIKLDAYDYDDPRLLERNLRLPPGF